MGNLRINLRTSDKGKVYLSWREALSRYGWYCYVCDCAIPKSHRSRICPLCGDHNMDPFERAYKLRCLMTGH